MKQHLEDELGLENVVLALNGVELNECAGDHKPRPERFRDKTLILSAANYYRRKGFEELIQASAPLLRDQPGLALVIFTDAPESLCQFLVELGIEDRVEIRPKCDRQTLLQWMAWSDLFAMPSWNESFGLVYAESMASGTPVLMTSDAGMSDELPNGLSPGWVVPPRDHWALQNALADAVSNPHRLDALGKMAAQWIHGRFSWQRNAENDKYFLLANTGWRSLSRFTVNVLVAKLAGAETYATLVLLLTAEIIVTTLLSAWLVVPMMNTTSGSSAATRSAVGRYALMRSVRWAGLLGLVALLVWAVIGFKDLGPLLATGIVLYVFMACVLQALRAWRAVCFESWHVFWADLVVFGLPIAAVLSAHYGNVSISLLQVLVWSSAVSAALACLLMMGKQVKELLQAGPIEESTRRRMAVQSGPILVGSLANTAGSRAYPILLSAIAISVEVARFGAVLTLIGPMRMLGMALSGVIRPRFALYYNQGEISCVRKLMIKHLGR
eukprot:g12147.t1